MVRRSPLRARLRYWFDNTMSRGTTGLIGWLGLVALLLILLVSTALVATDAHPAEAIHKLPQQVWATFVSMFGLGVPVTGPVTTLALLFIVALGGIFVVSALVGLLTSGLDQKMESLRKGRSLVVETDHTVILGWSDQVYTIVSELVEANRSRRRSAIAILAEQDKVTMQDKLRHRLGSTGSTRLVCRTGSPLDLNDLELVNLNAARAIIVLPPSTMSADDADAFVLKVLLAVNRGPQFRDRPHHVVASVRNSRNRPVTALAGGDAVVLDGDEIGARLVVQTARQPRLSVVYLDLLDFGGQEFYIVGERSLVGRTFGHALFHYNTSCPVGIARPDGVAQLNPPSDTVIGPNDKLIILAEDDSTIVVAKAPAPVDQSAIVHSFRAPLAPESTLMLGWNGRASSIIEQLDAYVTAGSTVDIVSDRPDTDGAVGRLTSRLQRLSLRVKRGDTRERGLLESLDVGSYGSIIVLADDELDPLAADSRVLVTLLNLRDILGQRGRSVQIVSEMRDERDRALAQLTRADDFVVSEQLVSLLMTQIAENRQLASVFADLFDADGAEIYIRPASYYIRTGVTVTFGTIVEAARRRGEVAIGYRVADSGDGHGVVLNPDKTTAMPVIDRVIVLAND